MFYNYYDANSKCYYAPQISVILHSKPQLSSQLYELSESSGWLSTKE